MYTIVLPITKQGSELFTSVGIKSYEQFLVKKDVKEFIIICPENEMQYFKNIVESSWIPFLILNEGCKLQEGLDTTGWYKQQLLKLLVSKVVRTQLYLVVDGDMYLNQLFTGNDLRNNGKIKYVSEPYQTENSNKYSVNSKWWDGSCDVLDINVNKIINDKHLMGVTPQILDKFLVDDLLSFVLNKFGKIWQQILCDKKFTEYTLYWLFIKYIANASDRYTYNGYKLWSHNHRTNTLDYTIEDKVLDAVRESFTNPTSFFSVIQGYLNVKLETIIEDINKSLKWSTFRSKEYDAIFMISSCMKANHNQCFTTEQRFLQTIETLKSIRQKVPNSFCILVEGSVCESKYIKKLESNFDMIRWLGNSSNVQHYVNHLSKTSNIGYGECKLLEIGVETILAHRIRSKRFFKLGARYTLTNKFNIDDWNTDYYCFRAHYDNSVHSLVYTTGLYSVPINKIDDYYELLKISYNYLKKYGMVEKLYRMLIPLEQIKLLKTIGLTGQLSYSGKRFTV